MKKHRKYIFIITFLLIITTIISISYAFYTVALSNRKDIAVSANIPSCAGVMLTSDTKITLTGDNSAPVSDSKALNADAHKYTFTVTNACTNSSYMTVALAPGSLSTIPARAIKYAIYESTDTKPSYGTLLSTNGKLLSEDIKNEVYSIVTDTVEVGYEVLSTTVSANTVKTYYMYVWVDENEGGLGNNTTMDKSFIGHLVLSNYESIGNPYLDNIELNSQITEQANNKSSQDYSDWAIVNEAGGLRYEGKDPDNYVCFKESCTDDELYRIIGKFTELVDTDNDGVADTNKDVIKIIKAKSLYQAMYWNQNTGNNWSESTTKIYLNETWEKPTNLIVTTRWHLKGQNSFSDVATFYNSERNGNTYGSNPAYVDAKVGLMYPSDYGYAVPENICPRNTIMTDYGTNNCYIDDWLYYGSEEASANQNFAWTLMHWSTSENLDFMIGNNGNLTYTYGNVNPITIRPTFYIDADSSIVSGGNGSKTNPYVIVPRVFGQSENVTYTSSQDGSDFKLVNEGNGLRYEGKDPDNYVCFENSCTNNTLYRIIGKFTEMVDTTGNGTADTNKEVVKIIKNTSIGNMSWDSGNSNNWNNASLNTYLNNNWTKPTDLILTTRWHLKSPTSGSNFTASQFLNYERNGSVSSGNSEFFDGKVGLMYPSDYGFAVLSENCSRNKYLYHMTASLSYQNSSCYNNDWLYLNTSSYEWTITHVYNTTAYAYRFYNGAIATLNGFDNGVKVGEPVRPTFYLDYNNMKIESGDGSKTNPYKLAEKKFTINNTSNTLSWNAVTGATSYDIYVDNVLTTNINTNSINTSTLNMSPGVHDIVIKAKDSNGKVLAQSKDFQQEVKLTPARNVMVVYTKNGTPDRKAIHTLSDFSYTVTGGGYTGSYDPNYSYSGGVEGFFFDDYDSANSTFTNQTAITSSNFNIMDSYADKIEFCMDYAQYGWQNQLLYGDQTVSSNYILNDSQKISIYNHNFTNCNTLNLTDITGSSNEFTLPITSGTTYGGKLYYESNKLYLTTYNDYDNSATYYYMRYKLTNSNTGTSSSYVYGIMGVFGHGCLLGDTEVYIYDKKKKRFKKKRIKYVDYEDELLVWDFDNGCFTTAKPLWIMKKQYADKYNELKFSDGSILKTVLQHRIFNKEKGKFTYPMSEDTPLGTTTYNVNGEYVKLISKEVIKKRVDYYNIITNYHINIFTSDILTSCRLNNIYEIKDMKFIKDNRKLHKRSEYKDIEDKYFYGLRIAEQPENITRDKDAINVKSIEKYVEHLKEMQK